MNEQKIKSQTNALLVGFSALLFTYTVLRALLLSITWDEAYTYIEFARNGKVILDKYEMMSANNHILNTALMIVFTKLFGVSEFVMRIPPLLAHLVFLYYSAKLVKNLSNKWLILAAFVVVNVNPYMLDFFVVARGYGLSIGLMMASVYYFYLLHKNTNEGHIKNATIAVLFGVLAVLANFVMLNYTVVMFGLLWVILAYKAIEIHGSITDKMIFVFKRIALPTLIMAFLFVFIVPITFKLKEAGALFFGGEHNFWSDTISTITDRCCYEQGYNYWVQRFAKGFVFLIFLGAILLVGLTHYKKRVTANSMFLGSLVLLIGLCSLSTIVQHSVMKTPYLLDRTALFLVVLFNLMFVFLANELYVRKPISQWIIYLSIPVLVFHFCRSMNISYVLEWKLDANVKEMLKDLEKVIVIPDGKETVSIGIPLIFDPAINFYREKDNLTWLNTAWRNETNNRCHDYYFLTKEEAEAMADSLIVLKTYPVTMNVLAKPKFPAKMRTTLVSQTILFEDKADKQFVFDTKIEYGPTFSVIVNDSIEPDKTGVLIFNADVKASQTLEENLIMVISFENPKSGVYCWQKAYIKDFIKTKNEWYRATFTCIVPQETHAGDEIKSYIWNPEKQHLLVKKMDLKWLGYKF